MSTPPCIALVGMTSAGKSSLINALFGKPVTEVKRTADTTHLVNRIEFSSDLVIYDTPGVGGDEQFENITRLFLGIPQDDELEYADSVPFKLNDIEMRELSNEKLRDYAPIDLVLLVIDISRTLTRYDKKTVESIFLRLKDVFGNRFIVVGTHLDELHEDKEEDKKAMIESYKKFTDNKILCVSTTTREGLEELVLAIFRNLPHNISLASLQKTLVQERKVTRLEFVLTEISNLLSDMMLLSGWEEEDIKITNLTLFCLICHHFSVNEETWLKYNGDAIQLSKSLPDTGIKRVTKVRNPKGFWEKIRGSLFGTKFFDEYRTYHKIGVAGLETVLPELYKLTFKLSELSGSPLKESDVLELIRNRQIQLEKAMNEGGENLSLCINELLRELFSQDR